MPILTIWPNSLGLIAVAQTVAFPTVRVDAWGWAMAACFIYNSGSTGPGKVAVKVRGPGDTAFGPRVTLNFDVEPVGFGISPAPARGGSWILSAVRIGDVEPSEWESTDRGQTWTLL